MNCYGNVLYTVTLYYISLYFSGIILFIYMYCIMKVVLKSVVTNAELYTMLLSICLSVCPSVAGEICQVIHYVAAPGSERGLIVFCLLHALFVLCSSTRKS